MAKKAKKPVPQGREEASIKSFLDMIAPSVVSFMPDHFICGNTYRCVWALREYPTSTDEQAILRHLGEKDGVTLRIYTRQVTPAEEKRIIQNAANKNRLNSSNTNDLQQTVTAESNLQDVATLVATMHRNREPLLHCAVYIELTASDYAFQVLHEQGYKDVAAEDFRNTAELLAAILCKGVSVQIKRGLCRQYITKEEPLASPRGKLEIGESIKTQVLRKKQLVCAYLQPFQTSSSYPGRTIQRRPPGSIQFPSFAPKVWIP